MYLLLYPLSIYFLLSLHSSVSILEIFNVQKCCCNPWKFCLWKQIHGALELSSSHNINDFEFLALSLTSRILRKKKKKRGGRRQPLLFSNFLCLSTFFYFIHSCWPFRPGSLHLTTFLRMMLSAGKKKKRLEGEYKQITFVCIVCKM